MTKNAIENVNRLTGKTVESWEDAYYTASKIVRDEIRRFMIVHVEMNNKGLNASVVVDKIMSDSNSIDGIIANVMNLIFDGINKNDLFANIHLMVSAWFEKYWEVEFNWAYFH